MVKPRKGKANTGIEEDLFMDNLTENGCSNSQPGKCDTAWFHLTNGNNLLEILSCDLIKPTACYKKYYQDLSVYCPGKIPLFKGAILGDLVGIVVKEDPAMLRPVILEIVLPEKKHAEAADEQETSVFRFVNGSRCITVEGVIPVSMVKAIHFRSRAEMEEITNIKYLNADPSRHAVMVSEELFNTDTAKEIDAFLEWLGKQDNPAMDIEHYAFNADSLSGGFALVLQRCYHDIGLFQAVADWYWCMCEPDLKTVGRESGAGSPINVLLGDSVSIDASESYLLWNAMKCASEYAYSDGWVPSKLLEQISDSAARGRIRKDKKDSAARICAMIKKVLNLEEDIKAFYSEEKSGVGKAIMLVLSNPDPCYLSELQDTAAERFDADTLLFASVLSGLIFGWTLLPIELRGGVILEKFISSCTAMYVNSRINSPLMAHFPKHGRPLAAVRRSAGKAVATLCAGAIEVYARVIGIREQLLRADINASPWNRAAERLAILMKWDDCIVWEFKIANGSGFEVKLAENTISIFSTGIPPAITRRLLNRNFRSRLLAGKIPENVEIQIEQLLEREFG